MIELRNLTKTFGSTIAVSEVSLCIPKGKCMALVGSSGSGKTTLLKMINRLVEPNEGQVLLGGTNTCSMLPHILRRCIGYTFQQVGLFPHFTVEENIAITPKLLQWKKEKIEKRIEELLLLVELEPSRFRTRLPSELSGGQQQRVGLARALAGKPEVLLLDEPFGALDPLTRERLQDSFNRIRRTLSTTALFVTHDIYEALVLADQVGVIDNGRIVQIATPRDLIQTPATPQVASLLAIPKRQSDALRKLLRNTP